MPIADTSSVLDGISSVLWPVLAAIALIFLLPVLKKVLESRDWTLKAGGMELSVQKASDQLSRQVDDLREQVVELRGAALHGGAEPEAVRQELDRPLNIRTRSQPRKTLLWVDDHPENNAYEAQALERMGWDLRFAKSTGEALSTFGNLESQVAAVITDLGRDEEGSFRPDAGQELITAIRAQSDAVPVFVYTTASAAEEKSSMLEDAGAAAVTASPTLLLHEILERTAAETP